MSVICLLCGGGTLLLVTNADGSTQLVCANHDQHIADKRGQENVTASGLARTLAQLPTLVGDARDRRGLNQREAAAEIGCSPSTLCRIESGQDCSLHVAVAVLRWLASQPEQDGDDRG